MLKRARMTRGNRHKYTISIDNDLIHSEREARNIFSFHGGALQKITEKHCREERSTARRHPHRPLRRRCYCPNDTLQWSHLHNIHL